MWKCINPTVYAKVSALYMTLPLSLKWYAPSPTDAKHILAKSLMEILSFPEERGEQRPGGFSRIGSRLAYWTAYKLCCSVIFNSVKGLVFRYASSIKGWATVMCFSQQPIAQSSSSLLLWDGRQIILGKSTKALHKQQRSDKSNTTWGVFHDLHIC